MPAMEQTGRLALPYILPAQAQKHVTHNEALQRLDAIVQLSVQGFGAIAPPATPLEGDIHALGAAPSGLWAGQPGKLAVWVGSGWLFVTPQEGWIAHDLAGVVLRQWRGGQWVALLQNLGGLGVGTVSDATNRLAVASDATLLTHAGTSHRLNVNKAAVADTASLVFQSGFSGRAEMGLAGEDAFSIKVSPNGSTFTTALSVNPTTGMLTGAAITQTATDVTAGRVLRVGAGAAQLDASLYRRGNVLGTVTQAGGVPTGALIETGTNANGSYTRFADGTQICARRVAVTALALTTAMGSLFRGTAGSFAFPAAFTQVDAVAVTLMGSQNSTIRSSAGVLKTRVGSALSDADWSDIALWSATSVTATGVEATYLSLFATGRWF